MISVTTIKDYIDKCDDLLLIATNDTAKPLVKEILAVLRSDLQGLAQGLSLNSADVLSQVDYIGDLKLLRAKLQKEYDARIFYSENITQNKEKKLFISHATYDKDYVGAIINLFESLGFREDEIICSAIPPYCIPLDNNVYSWLVKKFQNYDLHVIYTLSKTYYSRPACLNEMGAAWAMQQKWSAILLPDFDFSEIDGCIDPRQISIKLDDLDRDNLNFRLGELKDNLINEFGLRTVSSTYWERKRNEFLKQIEEIKKTRLEEDSSKDVETYNSTKISLRNDEIVL